MSLTLPTSDELRGLAGEAAFERGRRYALEHRVEQLELHEGVLSARVRGSENYRVRLTDRHGDLEWSCSCPAAGAGDFCKHLVALGLAALGRGEPGAADDDLLPRLRQQSVERLATWLYEQARQDENLAHKLRLRLGGVDFKALKKNLSAALSARGHLDYRAVRNYARRLDAPLELLEESLQSDAAATLPLVEYALERLLKVYPRGDDSSGALGERIYDFADLYRRTAAAARPEPRALARTLFRLQREDEWSFFPLAAYWDSLGEAGQAVYGELVEREFRALPPADDETSRFAGKTFAVLGRMEALARLRGDFQTLIAVLGYDLSSAFAYERIARACLEFDREREATQWAERGLKAHPGASGLQGLLAELYAGAGLDEEAFELLWKRFVQSPTPPHWQALKDSPGVDWPAVRERALAEVIASEPVDDDGRPRVDVRLRLLMADGDLVGLLTVVEAGRAQPFTLEEAAAALAEAYPREAAALLRRVVDFNLRLSDASGYARQVKLIGRALELDPESAGWLDEIKRRYARRPKLMALLGRLTE